MKAKIFLTAMLVCALTAAAASAKIWRVDNNAGSSSDFTTAQEAHDAAGDGDTLYFIGSPISYGTLTLTKKLIIYGPGYLLNQNPDTQQNKNSAVIDGLSFEDGSENSYVSGMTVKGTVTVRTQDITLQRNYITTGGYRTNCIAINNNIHNIMVMQNFLYKSYWGDCISVNTNCSNIIILNNIITSSLTSEKSINSDITSRLTISHNIIYGNIDVSNSFLDNNILRTGNFTYTLNSYNNNICDGTQFGTKNGNLSEVSMSLVFVDEGSSDGKFQLREDSPARGAGTGGTDIGMFGGISPYVLSGIPNIPSIYSFSGPNTATNAGGLTVRVKAKSNN